jgi:phosphatidate cytidylyltransferase
MRALTGTVFVIVLVGCILWRFESFAILFLVVTILGLWEFYGLAEKTGAKPQKVLGTMLGAYMIISIALGAWYGGGRLSILLVPFLFLPFMVELYRKQPHPFTNIAYTLLGVVYVALPFSLLLLIAHNDTASTWNNSYNKHLVLGFFLLMWTSDTGAYLSGRTFGKHKLFERISPKKTWEGTIGGAVFCIAVASTFGHFPYTWGLNTFHWIVIALIIVVAGNLGDLSESMFKRSINIKDSGTILPGHGGILDRFDAAIIAAPFVFTYLVMAKHWF